MFIICLGLLSLVALGNAASIIQQVSSAKSTHLSDLVDGIYWSSGLERMCPGALAESVVSTWKKRLYAGKVTSLTKGCGRMQNRLLTFQDSSKACARYRPNIDQIQGDIYSYHLAKVLRINNVLPTVLIKVRQTDPLWELANADISKSQWSDDKLVVLTQWMDTLQPAYIPKEFRNEMRKMETSDEKLLNKSVPELCELMQWSDLIVFDYLTSNLDRVVNNMVSQQWNSHMMSRPAHNLEKDPISGRLYFLDNESGLSHGYRLLNKYGRYHEALLESLCIFRQSTVKAVEGFFLSNNIEHELQKSLRLNEKYHHDLPRLPESVIQILNERVGKVYDKMQRCRIQYER